VKKSLLIAAATAFALTGCGAPRLSADIPQVGTVHLQTKMNDGFKVQYGRSDVKAIKVTVGAKSATFTGSQLTDKLIVKDGASSTFTYSVSGLIIGSAYTATVEAYLDTDATREIGESQTTFTMAGSEMAVAMDALTLAVTPNGDADGSLDIVDATQPAVTIN
jgi:hypothetical protein